MEDLDFDKFLAELDAELNGNTVASPEQPQVTPRAESHDYQAVETEAPKPQPRVKESRSDELRPVRPTPKQADIDDYDDEDEDWEDARPRKRPIGLLIFLLIVAILLAAALIVLTWMGRQNTVPAADNTTADIVVEETEPTAPPVAGEAETADDTATTVVLPADSKSYVIDTVSGVFHDSSCALVEEIADGASRYSDVDRDALVEQGFTACEVCNP